MAFAPGSSADGAADSPIVREAAGLPSLTLDQDGVDLLDVVVSGAFAPSRALTVTGAVETVPAVGERLALRDLEGVPLAVVTVGGAHQVGDHVTVTGELVDGRRPDRPDYAALRHSPSDVRAMIAERGWERPVTALVEELPPTPAAAQVTVADARGRLVVLALCTGNPGDPAHHARVRAWRQAFAPYERESVLAVVSARLPIVPRAAAEMRRVLADNFGADRLAPTPELDRQAAEPRRSGGATVFFTGLSGSGKSTIAGHLLAHLLELGCTASLLDGDVVRTHLSKGLGFSRADRDVNIRRIGFVAAEITKHGGLAICAPIAPYDETRRAVRAMVERYGAFVLVHVATPIEVCEARDRKGLYAKARAGEIAEFTGVSDPYEEPDDADLVIDTRTESADAAALRVVALLGELGVVPAGEGAMERTL